MKKKRSSKISLADDKISRKEALTKAGKYAAFTASAMLTILSPKESQAASVPTSPPVW